MVKNCSNCFCHNWYPRHDDCINCIGFENWFPVNSGKDMKTIVGWVILDRNGIPYTFVPKVKEFFGAIIENDAPSQEYIQHLERDWSGLAPFTVKEIFT